MKLVVAHKLVKKFQWSKTTLSCKEKLVCTHFNGFLKQFIDFNSFDKTVENIINNLDLFSKDWNFEQTGYSITCASTNTCQICHEKCYESRIYKSSNLDVILDFLQLLSF